MNLEALFIIVSVIGSIISTLTGNIFYVSAPLTVALLMNFINRGKLQQKTVTEVQDDENLIASLSQLVAENQKISEIINTKAPIEKLEKLEAHSDNIFSRIQNQLDILRTELTAKVNNSENLTASLSQLGTETQKLSKTINTKASIEKLEKLEARLNDISTIIQNQFALVRTELDASTELKILNDKLAQLRTELDVSTELKTLDNKFALVSTKLDVSTGLKTLDDNILKINSYLDLIVSHTLNDLDKNLLSANRKIKFQQEQIERLISEIELLKNPNYNLEHDSNKSMEVFSEYSTYPTSYDIDEDAGF